MVSAIKKNLDVPPSGYRIRESHLFLAAGSFVVSAEVGDSSGRTVKRRERSSRKVDGFLLVVGGNHYPK